MYSSSGNNDQTLDIALPCLIEIPSKKSKAFNFKYVIAVKFNLGIICQSV